ncbi:MAG: Maf family nucleotide pyrophosphatase [Prevotella sp.]|nr:Maf family nucleotide pyrophosphatase [Prevotella sp.]MCM1075291.1 Maf family nucleotide pyrophosphatase [Ruminococcus sp.]
MMKKIILASKSPRRQELLKMLDLPFEIAETIEVDEKYPDDISLESVPEYLSRLKAQAYLPGLGKDEMLITADTVVINNGTILGKPADAAQAKEMLRQMAGHAHTVVTGVSLTTANKQDSFSVKTEVVFAPLDDTQIDYYVDNYSPLDKAGAYGIQEWIGAVAVESIHGSFYNVMGLPVHQLYLRLKDF